MKPHRLSDLLADLHRRINPAYGPGRQKEEFVRALEKAGIRPEHGNRGDELETMVLVDQEELSRLRSSQAPTTGDASGVLVKSGEGPVVEDCSAEDWTKPSRSPAPAAVRVPELPKWDPDWVLEYPTRRRPVSEAEQQAFANGFQFCIAKVEESLASRLPALKPGACADLVEVAQELDAALENAWKAFILPAEAIPGDLVRRFRAALRAQSTTDNKEAPHA